MGEIIIDRIEKNRNVINYSFSVTDDLKKYFSGAPFFIEYPENIESVPDSVAVVPFVCNVLPIVWATNSKLRVKSLDEAFYNCIPDVKKGYEVMFPEISFKGDIVIGEVDSCINSESSQSAMFFSGGLDSVQTLISHLNENPILISIWGSDVRIDNKQGWERLHTVIKDVANKYRLQEIVIRSSFREFDCEKELDRDFREKLRDGWWHGVKHGIGLLGHVAPYAYLKGLSNMYIASTHTAAYGAVTCASDPTIDNFVRFVNCEVVHDGYEFSRQDKIQNMVQFCEKHNTKIDLHVCWESAKGSNCCRCEKCYRTIIGLILEMADPKDYGFKDADLTILNMQRNLAVGGTFNNTSFVAWEELQSKMLKNRNVLRKSRYWKDIKWIIKTDFQKPIKLPFQERLMEKIYANPLYQLAHKIKIKTLERK